jgi:hypothetical protein
LDQPPPLPTCPDPLFPIAHHPSEASRPSGTMMTTSSLQPHPPLSTRFLPPDLPRSRDHHPDYQTTSPKINKTDRQYRMIWPDDELFLRSEMNLLLLVPSPKRQKRASPAVQSLYTDGITMTRRLLLEKLLPRLLSDLGIPDWNLPESMKKC